jgi:large subunit ribosomal protein L23
MKLKPVITEKSLRLAKENKYTFYVDKHFNKHQIRKLIEEVFGVHVIDVKTISVPGEVKRTNRGRKRIVKPTKKAIVMLRKKEKIDLFEESKK